MNEIVMSSLSDEVNQRFVFQFDLVHGSFDSWIADLVGNGHDPVVSTNRRGRLRVTCQNCRQQVGPGRNFISRFRPDLKAGEMCPEFIHDDGYRQVFLPSGTSFYEGGDYVCVHCGTKTRLSSWGLVRYRRYSQALCPVCKAEQPKPPSGYVAPLAHGGPG